MELQSFIDNNSNYCEIIKQNGFKIKKYSKYNCILVKNYYDKELDYTNDSEYWKMYCRGAIIDTVQNKVICLPPVKAREIKYNDISFEDSEIQGLIDGTMINLFYCNNEWVIATRSEIGGYNKWNHKKSFRKMFEECLSFDISLLDTNCSYSFVLRHTENRNISPITMNELYLVEMYSYGMDTIQRMSVNDYPDILRIENIKQLSSEEIKAMEKDFSMKGYTIKRNNQRYKIINHEFEKVKSLQVNVNNDMIHYIELRQNGNLKDYLKYFPEKNKLFTEYRNLIHKLSNELYTNYKNIYIFKKIERKNAPYSLKPFIQDIHSIYKKTKKPISWNDIKDYIHSLPPKRIAFAINYSE